MAKQDSNFFEGVEKLLEIWFSQRDGGSASCDLRRICRKKWEALLKIVHCEIISYTHNEHIDAYVLSESSLFVARRRIILKTCGNTTPLQCLQPLIQLVFQVTGFDYIDNVFYSRKNFKRPDLQCDPHRNFEDEVKVLDQFFTKRGGSAYCFGAINRSCWYMYTLNPMKGLEDFTMNIYNKKESDQTLEILMTGLDKSVMSIFTRDVSSSAAEATQKSGIHKIIPSMKVDDFLFEPCGYSMNGINESGSYMTIHITPEPDFSYVSFETNIPQSCYKDIIHRVLNTFEPKNFVLTFFANENSVASNATHGLGKASDFIKWKRQDLQYCKLKDYDMTYAFYSKFPS